MPTLLIFLVVAVSYCYAQESSGDHVTITDDNNAYTKIENKWCGHYDDVYGSYNSLNEAMSVCIADASCGEVYDVDCDNQGVFKLCKKRAEIKASSSGSCIYERPVGYTKLSKKRCNDDDYSSFSTVADAKLACSVDSGCQGVYDNDCNGGENDIHLCPTGVEYKTSSLSCIYQKECAFVPVSHNECPSNLDLLECTPSMSNGELCEADRPLPDGNQIYDVNNCGEFDVFKCINIGQCNKVCQIADCNKPNAATLCPEQCATTAGATTAAATTQAATTAAATTAAGCIDTDNGLTDLDGSGCSSYTTRPSDCGEFDLIRFDTDDEWDVNFFANQMCCACGGGTSTQSTDFYGK